MSRPFDVIVVGGGPAGATAGALLAQQGMQVLICEGKVFPREKVCGEFMGTASREVLRQLGLLEEFDRRAGAWVRRVAACVGGGGVGDVLWGDMPRDAAGAWPRALGRGELDEMLLLRARAMGAEVRQPCHVSFVEGDASSGFLVASSQGELQGRCVVMAHGLAQRGGMGASEAPARLRREYVSFKGHMEGCELPGDAIAIAGARGIYAGLVGTSGGRYSLAFVVNRRRAGRWGNSAEAQLRSLIEENAAFGRMVGMGRVSGAWMASGPLEPGVREVYRDGRFFVGNAAGEVHALVGEGITLAMRGGAMLAGVLGRFGVSQLEAGGRAYERMWRSEFMRRYAAAQLFANLMMRPDASRMAASVLRQWPELMSVCVRAAGK